MVRATDLDIDPTDIEHEIEHSDRNSTRGVTYHLARVPDTDVWLHYTTFRTEDGIGYSIRDIGYLTHKAPDLSTNQIASQIRDEVDEATVLDADIADDLRDSADEIADNLDDEYTNAVGMVMEYNVHVEGGVHVDAGVMSSSDTDPYTIEVRRAVPDDLRDADDTGTVIDIVRRAYIDAVHSARPSNAGDHHEYAAYIALDDVDSDDMWQLRAVELRQQSVLPRQTARVQALRETGMRQREIADTLDIDDSTVSRHVSRADDLIEQAQWTVDHVEQ